MHSGARRIFETSRVIKWAITRPTGTDRGPGHTTFPVEKMSAATFLNPSDRHSILILAEPNCRGSYFSGQSAQYNRKILDNFNSIGTIAPSGRQRANRKKQTQFAIASSSRTFPVSISKKN